MDDDTIRNLADERKTLSVQGMKEVLNIPPSTVHRNRENVISRHDNARSRVARNVNLVGEILRILPPQVITYFDRCDTFLADKKYDDIDTVEKNVEKYFNEKPKKHYRRLITSLLKWWKEVVEREGDYVFSQHLQIHFKYHRK
ncbi:hypothetical protein WN51_06406 [Melipona quadrifasciata]|uniref:Histone-lysine N-methyltransferase SETMAR n=1 Tax=Melipona quadrifasciata TaxID=166423 RepID=A0A0N0U776_9HYME|nr:hypothetical protein WN51_06406 [Melipona quadrifasciata]